MKTFLAVYIGSDEAMQACGWAELSDAQRLEKQKRGIEAWHQWIKLNEHVMVDAGTPLGKTKSASNAGIKDIKNNLTGYTLVRAESHEAAARLFEKHPHFSIFPGDSIEIMECLPIPEVS
ncbi:MAG TPA: hypothetical protein VFM46_15960 [Pseudomonadales bacterium]|nr:hypothetical protein [Pseudomonadales bacterium]